MTDYKTYFGLSNEPFAPVASGTGVFVAPQVAATVTAFKKALASEDAIVTVTGPVGSGKTTVARHALESVAKFHIIVTIGRIQFGHDEVLELLLAGLGARQLPKSTVHRFAMFRRVLKQYAEQQTRVFILVEDASRIGYDALSELEAVTAADAGVSGGANLVLLGDQGLTEMLREPRFARIKQRIRARQKIAAQNPGELQGYLKHCFRLAGKEFESIFADDCCAALHRLSDGIPRMANNLAKATLIAAAEQDIAQIEASLVERIASEEFGLTGDHKVADIQAEFDRVAADIVIPEAEATPVAAPPPAADEPEADLEAQPEAEKAGTADPEPALVEETEPAAEPDAALESEQDDDIPELIQDTLPDLQVLAPQLMAEAESGGESNAVADAPADAAAGETEFELPILTSVFPDDADAPQQCAESAAAEPALEQTDADAAEPAPEPLAEPEPETETEPAAEINPEPQAEAGLQAEPEAEAAADVYGSGANGNDTQNDAQDVPDWERDPTLAQLRPDLDALERAMAAAQGNDDAGPASVLEENLGRQGAAPEPVAAEPEPEMLDIVPEITLDKQIQAKIDEATEALKQTHVDAMAEQESETATAPAPKTAAAGNAAAAEQTTAKPAESAAPALDLRPAEATRADQELEKIASDLAKAKTIEDVDDKLAETLFGEEFSMIAAQVAANAPSLDDATEVASGTPAGETMGSLALSLEEDDEPAAPAAATADPHNTSSSQRLQVLRDLNHTAPPRGAPANPDTTESIVMSGGGVELPPAKYYPPVDSIEDQISTSMTQTLKALNIDQVALNDDDDETAEKKGLFGLFRRR